MNSGERRQVVLLLDLDSQVTRSMSRRLQLRGYDVMVASSPSELVKWPRGHIVVTSPRMLTPFWWDVGATALISMGQPAPGSSCSAWIPVTDDGAALAQALAAFPPRPNARLPLARSNRHRPVPARHAATTR